VGQYVEETTTVDRKMSSVYTAEIGMALSQADAVKTRPQANEGEMCC
jgi:hypothetical protein